jgi:OmpA-OmpF porin, OOP family
MSVNLLDMATAAMGGNFSGALGSFLGESQSTASNGLSAVLPALIGGLVNKGSTQDGASSLLSLLNTPQVDSGIVGTLGNLFGNGGTQASGLVTLGTSLLGTLFGDKVGGMASAIGSVAGLKGSTASSLLSIAAPIVLGMLKSHVGQNNLGASGLMSLLKGQGQYLGGKIDPKVSGAMGFPSVAGLLGLGGAALHSATSAVGSTAAAGAAGATASAAGAAARATANSAGAAAAAGGSGLMKWLPWLVGAAVILWAVTGMRGCGQTAKVADAPAPAAPAVTAPAPAVATPAPAPEAAKPAVVGKPDAAKVYFEVGKFDPPADTAKLLDGMVDYARANANSKLSISGFHDKTGDAAKKAELAKSRGMAVKNALISAGVPEDRIMMQKPVETTGGGDNKEARRVEVSVAQ